MRKIFKTSMLLVLAVVMLFSSAMTCMAATPRAPITHSSGIVFVGTGSDKLTITPTYKTIAYVDPARSTGFGAEIVILVVENTAISANDIRMLDRYGNEIWEEEGAISNAGIRSFECGTDVYTVQIKTQSGYGDAYAGFVRSL